MDKIKTVNVNNIFDSITKMEICIILATCTGYLDKLINQNDHYWDWKWVCVHYRSFSREGLRGNFNLHFGHINHLYRNKTTADLFKDLKQSIQIAKERKEKKDKEWASIINKRKDKICQA